MKNNFRYLTYFLGIVCSITFLSCLDEDYFLEQFEKKYNKQWEKLFGKIDPEHDWNIISQIEAIIDVPAGGEYTARIYTTHPKDKRSRLVAQIPVEGTGSIRFDLEKISKDVYARVKDAQGKTAFEGYFVIDGHEVFISQDNARSGSISRAETTEQVPQALSSLNDATTFNVASIYRDGANEWNEITWFDNNKNNNSGLTQINYGSIKYVVSQGINGHDHINGIEADEQLSYIYKSDNQNNITCVKFKDFIYNIVRSGGVFDEGGGNLSSNTDNRGKEGMSGKVVYVTQSSGPVELSYVYGNTGLHSAMGYFYWKEGQDYHNAPKIVFMNNALPHHNLKVSSPNSNNNSSAWSDAIKLEDINTGSNGYGIAIGDANENNYYVFGPKYKLVYYGDDYNSAGSYNFPEGVHIGFFLFTNYWDKDYNDDGSGSLAWGCQSPMNTNEGLGDRILRPIFYSIPDYNKENLEYYNYRTSQDNKSNGPSSEFPVQNGQNNQPTIGEISAVTYKYQGNIILGFEDGVDKDMNDILLLVEADVLLEGENSGETEDFIEEDNNYTEPEPEPQSWIIACEDLGNIGDYDFNDAVFKVAHVAGTNKLTVTPLASGGTYDIEVRYKGTNISQHANRGNLDFHQLINSGAQRNNGLWQQINDKQKGNAGEAITITDDALTSGFSLANGDYTNHGFSIYVEKNNGPSITINQPALDKKAPQMLVLPEYWIWPYEGKIITSGYPDFEKWTNQQNIKSDWYTNPKTGQGYLVSDDTTGYPSTGGSGSGSGGTTGGGNTGEIPFFINGKQQDNLQIINDNNGNHVSIPTSAFNPNGDEITFEGSGLTIAINSRDADKQSGSTCTFTITKEMLASSDFVTNGAIKFYFWCYAAAVTKISIKNGGTGSGDTPTVPEEPEEEEVIPDNFSIAYTANNGSSTNLTMDNGIYKDNTTGYYYLSIPKSAFNASGTKVTFTISGEKLVSGSFLSKDGEEYLSNFHFDPKSETKKAELIINLTAEQYNELPDDNVQIYFWTGLSTISAVKISDKVTIPATIPLTVDSQQPTNLKVFMGGSGYYVEILRSNLSTNGATVTISTTGTTSPCLFRGNQYAEGDYGFSNSNGTYTCELSADQRSQITADPVKLYFWDNSISNVTGISITNKQAETGITLTVDGQVQSEKLTIDQNGYDVIRIPIKYFNNGNDGATITFTATNPVNPNDENGLGGVINANGGQTNIIYNALTVSEADLEKNNTDVDGGGYLSIFLPLNNTYGINAITIVNKNTIPIKVNGIDRGSITFEGNQFNLQLSNYDVTSSGAIITFNCANSANFQVNGQSYSNINGDQVVEVNNNSNLSVTINSGTINSINIVPKAADTPGGDTNTLPITGTSHNVTFTTPEAGTYVFTIPAAAITNSSATIKFNGLPDSGYALTVKQNANTLATIYTNTFELSNIDTNADITITTQLSEDVFSTITGITISYNNTGSGESGGGDTTDWMSYCAIDKKTATIPKSSLPIGNNGISLSINISKETNIIIGQGVSVWENAIQDYGTSTTQTISQDKINNISGDNIVIWLNASDATITNIEISAAN